MMNLWAITSDCEYYVWYLSLMVIILYFVYQSAVYLLNGYQSYYCTWYCSYCHFTSTIVYDSKLLYRYLWAAFCLFKALLLLKPNMFYLYPPYLSSIVAGDSFTINGWSSLLSWLALVGIQHCYAPSLLPDSDHEFGLLHMSCYGSCLLFWMCWHASIIG